MTETEEPQSQPENEGKPAEQPVPGTSKDPDYGHDEERYEPDQAESEQVADPAEEEGSERD